MAIVRTTAKFMAYRIYGSIVKMSERHILKLECRDWSSKAPLLLISFKLVSS